MGYVITAYYRTGDSFHSEDTSTELSPVWENLDDAKEALRWLNEHHQYYEEDNSHHRWPGDKSEDISDLQDKPWYKPKQDWAEEWHYSCVLPYADGSVVVHVPYHGYFERLHRLKIIAQIDGELSFDYN